MGVISGILQCKIRVILRKITDALCNLVKFHIKFSLKTLELIQKNRKRIVTVQINLHFKNNSTQTCQINITYFILKMKLIVM